MHSGVDLAAPTGSPVVAAADGVVAYANWMGSYGLLVTLRHASGFETRFAHLSRILVSPGQQVTRGQVLGLVGSTGRSTGAHLHYEFVVGGVHRNPRTVKLPQAHPLEGVAKVKFASNAKQLIAQLKSHERVVLASNQ